LLFIYCYIAVVTFFVGFGTYKLYKQYIHTMPQTIVKTKVVTKTISHREVQKQIREKKTLRDSSYEAVYKKCKEASQTGEVMYFSLEDIDRIVDELKNEQVR